MAGGSIPADDGLARRGFTLVEVMVVVAILATLMVLLVPAVQSARESARRVSCINNQRQLTLAVIGFGETNGFVPGWRNELRISGTFIYPAWPVMIMPFADMSTLYNRITSGNVSAYNSLQTSGTGVVVMSFICPSRPRENTDPRTTLSYAGNCGSGSNGVVSRFSGVMLDTSGTTMASGIRLGRVSLADISAGDGTGNTAFLSEKSVSRNELIFPQGVWTGTSTTGTSCTFATVTGPNTYVPGFGLATVSGMPLNALSLGGPSEVGLVNAPSSNHPAGVVMSFGDGRAQFVAETLQPQVYAQLLSWNHGQAKAAAPYSTWVGTYSVLQETDY